MAKNPSSLTPHPSGDDKPAANKTRDKYKAKPDQKLKPDHSENGTETSISLRVLEGGGLIGALVIWAEMSECHVTFTLFFYFGALLFCYAGICHLVYQFLKKRNWAAKFSIVLWFVLATFTAVFVNKNSHSGKNFVLKLLNSEYPDFVLTLPNEPISDGLTNRLIIPINPENPKVEIQLQLDNNSDETIDIVESKINFAFF